MKFKKVMNKNSKELGIITRPNASSGLWLCALLPIAFLITNLRHPFSTTTFEYRMISITTFGLCLQSINFFLYLAFNGGRIIRFFYTFIPGFLTSALYFIFLKQTIIVCLFWGIISTVFYQYIYIKTLRTLPKSFTFGEACIVVQSITLFIISATLQIPHFIIEPPHDDFMQMVAIVMEALLCLLLTFSLMYYVQIFRNAYLFYPLMIINVITFCFLPVTPDLPVITLFNFIFQDKKRIFLIIYYAGLIGLAVASVIWQMKKTEKATTTVRKIFHFIMILVFIPGLLYECVLLFILTAIAFALLILLEVLRIAEIYPFEEVLKQSVTSFTDDKDSGLIAFTPMYLLAGCTLPIWIHPLPCSINASSENNIHLIVMLSGVISIGIGDTFASLIGSKIGNHKFFNSQKSIEGTLAGIIFQFLFIATLFYLKIITFSEIQIFIVSSAIVVTSLVEAFTDQVDNLILPLGFYIIVCLA